MREDEINEILKNKAKDNYAKGYIPMDAYNIIQLANAKKKRILFQSVSILSLCVFLCLGLFVSLKYLYEKDNNYANNLNMDYKYDNQTTQTILYHLENDKYEVTDRSPVYIAIINVENVRDLGIINLRPETYIKANVVENLKGNLEQSNIKIKLDETIVSINQIPEEIKSTFDFNTTESYVRIVLDEMMINTSYPVEGKHYIVSLIIEDGNLKVLNHCIYPFNEFDIETRKVKVGNEWIELEI